MHATNFSRTCTRPIDDFDHSSLLEVAGGRQKYLHLLLCQHSRDSSFHTPQPNKPRWRPIDEPTHVKKIEEATEGVQGPMDRCPLETLSRDKGQKIPNIKMCGFCCWHFVHE